MSDSTTTSVTIDHLYAGNQPQDKQTGVVTIAQSQTLARGAAIGKVVYGAVTATADAGNTGDGTCTVLSILPGAGTAKVGDYNLECVTAVTNGGVFKLEDPNGLLITNTLTMTAGAGAATVFEAGGLTFTLTDGTTDFAAGDLFVVAVAAGSEQGLLLDKDATDGSNVLYGILTEAVTTGVGETQVAAVDKEGRFNTAAVTFASGTAYTDIEDDARLKSIYFQAVNF